MIYLAIGGLIAALLFFLRRDNRSLGESEAENKSLSVVVDDIRKANDARNDPIVLARMREKYERKE